MLVGVGGLGGLGSWNSSIPMLYLPHPLAPFNHQWEDRFGEVPDLTSLPDALSSLSVILKGDAPLGWWPSLTSRISQIAQSIHQALSFPVAAAAEVAVDAHGESSDIDPGFVSLPFSEGSVNIPRAVTN